MGPSGSSWQEKAACFASGIRTCRSCAGSYQNGGVWIASPPKARWTSSSIPSPRTSSSSKIEYSSGATPPNIFWCAPFAKTHAPASL